MQAERNTKQLIVFISEAQATFMATAIKAVQAEDTAKKKTEFFTGSVEAPPTLSKVGASRAKYKTINCFYFRGAGYLHGDSHKGSASRRHCKKKTAPSISVRKFRMYIRKFRMYVRGSRMYILSLRTELRAVSHVWASPQGSGPMAPGRVNLASV